MSLQNGNGGSSVLHWDYYTKKDSNLTHQNCILNMDWKEMVFLLPSGSVDLVLTDPPYESVAKMIGGSTARLGRGRIETEAWAPDKFIQTISNGELWKILHETYRILKPNRHAFIMSDGATLPWLLAYLGCGPTNRDPRAQECITYFDHVKILVWNKMLLGLGYHFRAQHEFILMLDKGKNRKPHDLSVSDVLPFKALRGYELNYPTQKPWQLFRLLIEQATEPGELVVDPFIGSGTTAVACIVSGRKYIGSDISETAIKIANGRIERCKKVKKASS